MKGEYIDNVDILDNHPPCNHLLSANSQGNRQMTCAMDDIVHSFPVEAPFILDAAAIREPSKVHFC